MSATFPIGALVRVGAAKPNYRGSFGSRGLYGRGQDFLVIGESWTVKGGSEIVDCEWTEAGYPVDGTGRLVTHPDWTCVPLVAVHSVAFARDCCGAAEEHDDETFRSYFGDEATIHFADVEDLVRAEVPA